MVQWLDGANKNRFRQFRRIHRNIQTIIDAVNGININMAAGLIKIFGPLSVFTAVSVAGFIGGAHVGFGFHDPAVNVDIINFAHKAFSDQIFGKMNSGFLVILG